MSALSVTNKDNITIRSVCVSTYSTEKQNDTASNKSQEVITNINYASYRYVNPS